MYSPFRTSEAYRGEKPVALIIFAIGGFARSGTIAAVFGRARTGVPGSGIKKARVGIATL